jgi:hypothetical protein
MSGFETLALSAFADLGETTVAMQKELPNLLNVLPLKFDFYLEATDDCLAIVVETDGDQHFRGNHWFTDALRTCDRIKNRYAKANGIHVLRIGFRSSSYPYIREEIQRFLKDVRALAPGSPPTIRFVGIRYDAEYMRTAT